MKLCLEFSETIQGFCSKLASLRIQVLLRSISLIMASDSPSSFYNLSGLSSVNVSLAATPAISSSSGIIGGGSGTTGVTTSANPVVTAFNGSSIFPSVNVLVDPVPGHKHDNSGQVVNWSWKELIILKQGLVWYANEPNIMKYVKIAAHLQEKTVRDVALRCQWLKKKEQFKRRKPEENYVGKKGRDRKEKMVECSPLVSANIPSHGNLPTYSHMMHNVSHNTFSSEAPTIDDATRHLLEENAQILRQVNANIATWKLQDNVDLIFRSRNNIIAILNRMSEMPGMMRRMHALPLSVNDKLVDSMLQNASQVFSFG